MSHESLLVAGSSAYELFGVYSRLAFPVHNQTFSFDFRKSKYVEAYVCMSEASTLYMLYKGESRETGGRNKTIIKLSGTR